MFVNYLAEEEGFEPPVPYGTTVFKTAAFDRSATPLFDPFQPFPSAGRCATLVKKSPILAFKALFWMIGMQK